jgi:thiosulfate/3-mercaptopyruvate sulfurtransferase
MMKPQAVVNVFCWAVVQVTLALAGMNAAALEVPGPLVETGWLAHHQGDVVVLDVRKDAASYLGKAPAPGKKPALKHLTGHIPGAISVPWKKLVTKRAEQGVPLKAMLPSPEAFGALMQRSGVDNDSAVVIAGRGATAKDQAYAARLYWTLKYFGHDNVALLDGGTAQWAKEERPLAYTAEAPPKGDFLVAEIREHLLAGTQDVEDAIASGGVQLVDCRTEDFYLGLSYHRKFVSPAHKGHLSGAKTMPFVLLGDNTGPAKLFSEQQMRKVAALKGVDLDTPTIIYCNSGVTASVGWFVLHEILGNEKTRLYDGSMHAWSNIDAAHSVASIDQLLEETMVDKGEESVAESPVHTAYPRPLRSLQALVDDRRDALRRRRNDYFDVLSGRRFFQPPWITARKEMMDGYRDSMRATHRQYKDAVRLHQDALRDAYAPWARPFRDWAEIRHFVSQMEQLDRQDFHDRLSFTHAYIPW